MEDRPQLRSLADRAGVLPSYFDISGVRRVTKDATAEALLTAMGFDASTEAAAEQALASLERSEQGGLITPVRVVVARPEHAFSVQLAIPREVAAPVDWRIELREEGGASHVASGRSTPAAPDHAITVPSPATLPAGYHVLEAKVDLPGRTLEARQSLIVSPGRCMVPAQRVGERRVYGLWTNLYTVRSQRNWGVGDLTDLCELVKGAARHGAAFVGLNPLHALRNRGEFICPYAPLSRLFRNVVYLDLEVVPEFGECRGARTRLESPTFQAELAPARSARHVDYQRLAALKIEVLRLLYDTFVGHMNADSDRGQAYARYVAEHGKALTDFATFQAMENRLGKEGHGKDDWRDWPEAYRTPDSAEVNSFRSAHRREVDFHCYVQFELERQLAAVADEARRSGAALGLYQDLALGSAGDGSDAWAFPGLFLDGVSVGAPPDPYCDTGQTWNFPPVDPRRLAADRYDYWIRLLGSNLKNSGMLRIDHVMGLFRQYCVPDGLPATDGAYVRYPADDLLGILALESQRHGTVIVGEDLGTVPPELPSILEKWGILSSRVLYFERDGGDFRPSASYSPRALVTATTHDHPPLAGFWTGLDLEIRHKIGLIGSDREKEEALAEREHTRAALLRRLIDEGLLPDEAEVSTEELCEAVHGFLARTPCPLVGISLDDLGGETEAVNLPGVGWRRYRSWSRRMRRSLEDILADPAVTAVLDKTLARLGGSLPE